ncbi:MAG: endonuclease/exonuclease/phosphatase family protein [Polyangiales bacterium]
MHRSWVLACLLTAACSDDGADEVRDDEPADASVRDAEIDARPQGDLDARVVDSATLDAQRPDAGPDASLPVYPTLRVLSYNVAGLPEGISSSMPSRNSTLISPLLNDYGLALLQEDFTYHAQIVSMARHPHQSPSDTRGQSLGDGLNFLSDFPYTDLTRVKWSKCNGLFDQGSDCLTPKGYTFARFEIDGMSVDVYNWHADAGSTAADQSARADNLRQLAAAIRERSPGRAVIVAGDTNSRYTRAGDVLPELLAGAGLSDVGPQGSTPACNAELNPDDANCERIDKILYRSGDSLELRPFEYRVEGAKFSDPDGMQLSDHRPVSVSFELVRVGASID